MRKILSFVSIITLLTVVGIAMPTHAEETTYYLFTSAGCPHCTKVKSFIDTSNLNDLANIEILDTSVDQAYITQMMDMLEDRGAEYQGVPTLIAGDDVAVGDTPIISFFRTKFPDLVEYTGDTVETSGEPIDWGQNIVLGIVGLAGAAVVVLIVISTRG